MADLSDLIDHIPDTQQQRSTLKCCCGRRDCAFLVHNGEVLDKLEGDVTLAAQMGQVRSLLCLSFCVHVTIDLRLQNIPK